MIKEFEHNMVDDEKKITGKYFSIWKFLIGRMIWLDLWFEYVIMTLIRVNYKHFK